MSMWSTVLPVWAENRSAPAPLAARTLSKSGPAVCDYEFPGKFLQAVQNGPGVSFRAVSPVMMMAPVDTSWGSIPRQTVFLPPRFAECLPHQPCGRQKGVK